MDNNGEIANIERSTVDGVRGAQVNFRSLSNADIENRLHNNQSIQNPIESTNSESQSLSSRIIDNTANVVSNGGFIVGAVVSSLAYGSLVNDCNMRLKAENNCHNDIAPFTLVPLGLGLAFSSSVVYLKNNHPDQYLRLKEMLTNIRLPSISFSSNNRISSDNLEPAPAPNVSPIQPSTTTLAFNGFRADSSIGETHIC
jgi:hypothetical protein